MPKRSWVGIGPKIAVPTILFCALAAWLTSRFPRIFTLSFPSVAWRRGIACVLALAGLAILLRAGSALKRARARGALARTGPYRFIRHPLYASWIFLWLPALTLFLASWIFFLASVVFYLAFRRLIGKEEANLLDDFGDEYEQYRKATPLIFPRFTHRERESRN